MLLNPIIIKKVEDRYKEMIEQGHSEAILDKEMLGSIKLFIVDEDKKPKFSIPYDIKDGDKIVKIFIGTDEM